MKCIILAAGASTRLQPLTESLPKCLLPVGGKSILQRTIENMLPTNITQIAIVVGFEAEKIRSHLRQQFPNKKFRYILNPNYGSTNNAYSLLLAREFFLDTKSHVNANEDLVILDSDIIFHPGLMQFLERDARGDRIAVRVRGEHDEEEVHISVDRNGHVSNIGKDVSPHQTYGESIGIVRFSRESGRVLFEVLEQRVRLGNGKTEYYESAFQEIINLGVKIKAIDVSDFPVIEIDSQSDLELARRVIVPSIETGSDVRIQ